jgi:hypothetical protein
MVSGDNNGKRVDGWQRANTGRPTFVTSGNKGDRHTSDSNAASAGGYVPPVARMSNGTTGGDATIDQSNEVLRRYTRHGGIVAGGGGGTGNLGFLVRDADGNASGIHINPYGLPTGDTPVSSLHDIRQVGSVLATAGDESSISIERRSSNSQSQSSIQYHYGNGSGRNSNNNSITIAMPVDNDSLRRPSTAH